MAKKKESRLESFKAANEYSEANRGVRGNSKNKLPAVKHKTAENAREYLSRTAIQSGEKLQDIQKRYDETGVGFELSGDAVARAQTAHSGQPGQPAKYYKG